MEREYEIFERLPNGEVTWRGTGHGLEDARRKIEQFAKKTSNELFAIHLSSRQVVARINEHQKTSKRVFQIAYDGELLVKRAKVLRSEGYSVTSATRWSASTQSKLSLRNTLSPTTHNSVQKPEVKWVLPLYIK